MQDRAGWIRYSNRQHPVVSITSESIRELLLLLHEHLRASGLALTAATLLEETQLTPLPSLDAPSSLAHQGFGQSTPNITCYRRSGLQSRARLFRAPSLAPKEHHSQVSAHIIEGTRVCPEPRRRSLDVPSNVTARLSTREFGSVYGGVHGGRKDRQYVYSRFRRRRTCRDETSSLQTCMSFLGDSSRIVTGGFFGELKVFGSNSNRVLDCCTSHQLPVTLLQSRFVGVYQLVLSSTAKDVCLWDASSISGGPKHSFKGIKAAIFSNSGSIFAALRSDPTDRKVHLYNVQTCQLDSMLSDSSRSNLSGRGHEYSPVHFSPSDSMLLWKGVLWDRRCSDPIHRFDQFADYGGGGFHPAGNQVIINSNVLDLRNLRLLCSVPSLNQTVLAFNATGDVIYAIRRRDREDVNWTYKTHRVKHPLLYAFHTVDAVNYSDIATIPVGRFVLDFATEPTDSFLGLMTMDYKDFMYSSARVYEIGRRKPMDDDSDADSEDEGEDAHSRHVDEIYEIDDDDRDEGDEDR